MKRTALVPGLAVLLLGLAPASAAPTDPHLFSRPAHATLFDPDAAIQADMDDDGRLDIVAAVGGGTATLSYGVSVMRASTIGYAPATFTLLPNVPVAPVDVAVADVDEDGRRDVVASVPTGESARSAHLFPGFGDGQLDQPIETSLTGYTALALGEFSPGQMGAVSASEEGVTLWRASGADFTMDRPISTDPANELLAADLDGDGVDEIVTSDGERVSLYRGLARVASSPLGEVISLTAADVTGDGRPEAIATSGAGDVKVFDSSFSVVRSIAPNNSALAAGAGDLDEDGKIDLVRANDTSTLTVALGSGVRKDIAIAQAAFAVFVRDATGDGNADLLAVQHASSIVEVVEGDGEGGFTAQRPTVFTNPSGWSTEVADFNNDGNLDVIAAQLNYLLDGYLASSTARVILGNGNGGFTPAGSISTQGSSTAMDVGDVNGDGKVDVVVSDYHSGTVSQYLGNGSGGFGDRIYVPGCPLNDAVVIGDFNGDAYADAAAACREMTQQNTLSIYLGSPVGLAPGVTLGLAHTNAIFSLRTGDLNGDGKTDLILHSNALFKPCVPPAADCLVQTSYAGAMSYFLGLGNGAFEPSREYLVGSRFADAEVRDVNGDARSDILAAVFDEDRIQIALGQADGTLAAPYSIEVLEYPASVQVAEVTGDGKVDLVMGHGPNMISVAPGNGNGTFGASTGFAARAPMGGVQVADFTKDGKRDVFVPEGGVGELFINGV